MHGEKAWVALALLISLAAPPARAEVTGAADITELAPLDPIVREGLPVYGPDDRLVGTVLHIEGDTAVIDTGTAKITVTLLSIFKRSKGLEIALTRGQLEAASARVQAKGDAEIRSLLLPGTLVYGRDGQAIARVEAIEDERIMLAMDAERLILPLASFGRDGARATLRLTRDELRAQVAAQRGAGGTKTARIDQPQRL